MRQSFVVDEDDYQFLTSKIHKAWDTDCFRVYEYYLKLVEFAGNFRTRVRDFLNAA